MPKLNYKIVGRRPHPGALALDCVAVEWTHADGPVKDTVLLPDAHPPVHPGMPEVGFVATPAGERAVVLDQVEVPRGTPDSIVMQILEEKRARLAANLGVEP